MFPYTPRKYQAEILDLFRTTLHNRGHLILEAGTGSGKTVCALEPALEFAVENKKRIVYVTRTNAQQKQVIYELRQITKKNKIFGCPLQGRRNLCPLIKDNPELLGGTPEELSKICTDRKRNTLGNDKKGCRYFKKNCTSDISKVFTWTKNNLPTVEELADYCKKRGLCPYEIIKLLINDAILVVAPYIYFFDPFLRQHLLEMMNVGIEDVLLIVDEAHNLPEYARSLKSITLSLNTLKFAEREVSEFGDIETAEKVMVSDFCAEMKKILLRTKNEYVSEEDALIPPDEIESEIMSSFKISSTKLCKIIKNMIIYGELVKEIKRKKGKLPRSYIHSVGAFLLMWTNVDEHYVKIVNSKPEFEIYCLDPSLAAGVVNECFSSSHMSGTLLPLDEYRDSVGLPSATRMFSFPSPFPEENRKIFFVDDVTTRYEELSKDEAVIKKLETYIKNICNSFQRNIIVFFPSFELMKKMNISLNKNLYVEGQGMHQQELMNMIESFKLQKGGVLFSVAGGRISEGIDFPGKTLEIAVLVGLPYPKPTAKHKALQNYYDIKFGKGWEYTVRAPAIRKTLQCIGRLIRDENDKAAAVILDKRARHFRKQLDLNETKNVVKDLQTFFNS
ncbi:MAG: ATP-dependent DNA helicase [Thermoplasmatales archaeon]|nr:ATP-dependent DNA helicase [Thermoplasmatales archaeon]